MPDHDSWLEAGAFAVAERVHRIPLPLPDDGLRSVNVYAITDGDGLSLIDSGWALAESRDRLEQSLGLLGHDLSSIKRFLVTHIHRDHYSQASLLRKLFGSRIGLGAGERDNLTEMQLRPQTCSPKLTTRFVRAGARNLIEELVRLDDGKGQDPAEWVEPDDWLHDGDVISVGTSRLAVVATPGHTAGHVMFHDADNQLLFSGDHILPTITPSIGYEPSPTPRSLQDYLNSLARAAAIAGSILLPAHGPVRPSAAQRVADLQQHHTARLEHTLEAVCAGASTAIEVAKQLRWTRHERRLEELSLFNQMLAVNETLAHLEALHFQGAAELTVVDAVAHYMPT
jgi:glyoxylase-like metal-dependent hydrolase (beta-lactamase superfamily II)